MKDIIGCTFSEDMIDPVTGEVVAEAGIVVDEALAKRLTAFPEFDFIVDKERHTIHAIQQYESL